MIKTIVHSLFVMYTLILFGRIAISWFPQFQSSHFSRFLIHYTEPYLALFRKVIPPLGGMLDLSPLFAFFALRIAENLIMRIL